MALVLSLCRPSGVPVFVLWRWACDASSPVSADFIGACDRLVVLVDTPPCSVYVVCAGASSPCILFLSPSYLSPALASLSRLVSFSFLCPSLYLALPPPCLPHATPPDRCYVPPSFHPSAGWARFGAGWPGGAGTRRSLQDGGPRGQRTGVNPSGDEER